MRKYGFFLAFFQTIFEFYEGVFKMTVFLPFTLLQAWHLSRTSTTNRQLILASSLSPPSPPYNDKTSKVSWDKDAQPRYSILKNTRENQGKTFPPREQNIVNKLELIGREIEQISDLLLRTDRRKDNAGESTEDCNVRRRRGSLVAIRNDQKRSQSLDTELETRSTSFQDLRNIFQEKSNEIVEIENNATKPLEVDITGGLKQGNVNPSRQVCQHSPRLCNIYLFETQLFRRPTRDCPLMCLDLVMCYLFQSLENYFSCLTHILTQENQ